MLGVGEEVDGRGDRVGGVLHNGVGFGRQGHGVARYDRREVDTAEKVEHEDSGDRRGEQQDDVARRCGELRDDDRQRRQQGRVKELVGRPLALAGDRSGSERRDDQQRLILHVIFGEPDIEVLDPYLWNWKNSLGFFRILFW